MDKDRFKDILAHAYLNPLNHSDNGFKLTDFCNEVAERPEIKSLFESEVKQNKSVNLMPQSEQTKGCA